MLLGRRRFAGLWADLDPMWHLAFELAWEAYRAGSVPVGAVVSDAEGLVAKGRNRIYDLAAPEGRLSGTRLAHAEVDALAALGPERRHEDRTLWTTAEPCLLCVGAAAVSTVGTLRYASADPYGGAAAAAADRPLVVEGPLPAPLGAVGAVLHVEPYLRNNPDGAVVAAYRRAAPDALAAATTLVAHGVLLTGAAKRVRFESLVPDLLAALPE